MLAVAAADAVTKGDSVSSGSSDSHCDLATFVTEWFTYIDKSSVAALPHQQLDILIKIGALTGNVFQPGSHSKRECVEHRMLAFGVMDLVGTGAYHDPAIPVTGSAVPTAKSELRWKHCHAGLDDKGSLQGTGYPSVSLLFRIRDSRLPENIVKLFPELLARVLADAQFSSQLACLMHACASHPSGIPAEDVVRPVAHAPGYSMAAAHRLKKAVAPFVQRGLVGALTTKAVNVREMADPILSALVEQIVVQCPMLVDKISTDKASVVYHADACDGLGELVADLEARVQAIKQQKTVHSYAAPTPPWPGGWPTFALTAVALISWDDTQLRRAFDLMDANSGHVAIVQRLLHVMRTARAVFAGRKAALVEAGTPSLVYTVLQSQAATVFYALHGSNFWDACIQDGLRGESHSLKFKEKDTVMLALSAFGRTACASIFGELQANNLSNQEFKLSLGNVLTREIRPPETNP